MQDFSVFISLSSCIISISTFGEAWHAATWDWVEILIDSTYKISCFVYDEGKLNHFRMEAYFLTKELSQ